jgi:hypothetical protein
VPSRLHRSPVFAVRRAVRGWRRLAGAETLDSTRPERLYQRVKRDKVTLAREAASTEDEQINAYLARYFPGQR